MKTHLITSAIIIAVLMIIIICVVIPKAMATLGILACVIILYIVIYSIVKDNI